MRNKEPAPPGGTERRLGDLLREARTRSGLSIRQAARGAGISHVSWGRFESNSSTPKYGQLDDIAEVLGIEVADFLPSPDAVKAVITVQVGSDADAEATGAEVASLLGVDACYVCEDNELLLEVSVPNARQLRVLLLSVLKEFDVVKTDTFLVLERHPDTPHEEGLNVKGLALSLRDAFRAVQGEGDVVTAWVELRLDFRQQQQVAEAVASQRECDAALTVTGSTDLLAKLSAKDSDALRGLMAKLEEMPGVSSLPGEQPGLRSHLVLREIRPRKWTAAFSLCGEVLREARETLERDYQALEGMRESNGADVERALATVSDEAQALHRVITGHGEARGAPKAAKPRTGRGSRRAPRRRKKGDV